ncbi:hypothetical protein TNCV_5015521 [Trichonephila clavipes]|nr:hypothetical protein TNCV_5015521 [Trichonephila clavipes]
MEAHEIHNRKGLHVPLSLAVAMSTIKLGSTLILRENTLGEGHRPSTSLPHPRTSREDLRLDGPSCREGTIHLETSKSSQGLEPRPYGTASQCR